MVKKFQNRLIGSSKGSLSFIKNLMILNKLNIKFFNLINF